MFLSKLRESILAEMTKRQKKALKKDHFLNIAKASNKLPSFDEVWKVQSVSDGPRDFVENLVYSKSISGYEKEFKEETGKDPGKNDHEFAEWLLQNPIRHELKRLYDEAVSVVSESDGDSCWREIKLPENIDPSKHDGLGVYWALAEDDAEAYWGKHGKSVVYRAEVDESAIDKYGTIMARTDLVLGETENEIRFLPNAKIFVYEASVEGERYPRPINALRRL